MRSVSDKKLIDFTRFVATKFSSNAAGWKYSRDKGDLVHIRYRRDFTGYNHWIRRWGRALNVKRLLGRDRFSRQIGLGPGPVDLKGAALYAWVYVTNSIRKEKNLPDGQVNGNLTFWEEDGEYITMMGPTVGVKVLEFLEAEPENPHARAILDEMHKMYQLSWGKNKDND